MTRQPVRESAGVAVRFHAAFLFLCWMPSAAPAQQARAPASERRGGVVALVNGGLEYLAQPFDTREIDGEEGEHILFVVRLPADRDLLPLGRWTGTTTRIELDATSPLAGNDRHWADRLEHAGRITLTGGDSKSWFMLLMPGGTRSALGRAIQSAHRAGACIVAQGAAAPLLGEWALIDTALFGRVQRNPRQATSVVAFRGLDLVHGVCVESSDASSGSLARCLTSALDIYASLWLVLDGPIAWIDGGTTDAWRATGPGAAIILDLTSARRQRDAVRTGRITLVSPRSDGARLDPLRGVISTAQDPMPIAMREAARTQHLAQDIDVGALLRGVGNDGWLRDGRRVELDGPTLGLSLWTDERSRFSVAGPANDATFALVAFDLERVEP